MNITVERNIASIVSGNEIDINVSRIQCNKYLSCRAPPLQFLIRSILPVTINGIPLLGFFLSITRRLWASLKRTMRQIVALHFHGDTTSQGARQKGWTYKSHDKSISGKSWPISRPWPLARSVLQISLYYTPMCKSLSRSLSLPLSYLSLAQHIANRYSSASTLLFFENKWAISSTIYPSIVIFFLLRRYSRPESEGTLRASPQGRTLPSRK